MGDKFVADKNKKQEEERLASGTHEQHPHHSIAYPESATPWKVGTLTLAVLLIVSVLTGGFGYGTGKALTGKAVQEKEEDQEQPETKGQQPLPKAVLKEDNDPALGDRTAPVTIFEFSDYQCPFCARAFQQTYPEILQQVEEGKVRFIFKDYPLNIATGRDEVHPNADNAAIVANCAGEQGKYFAMHDLLFQEQETWSEVSDPSSLFKKMAQDLGLNEKQFDDCLAKSKKHLDEIKNDVAEGSAAGVEGTPTFFINGQKVVGAQPWSVFENIIKQEVGT